MGIYSDLVWGAGAPELGRGRVGLAQRRGSGSACAPQGQNIWKSELLNIKVFVAQVQTAISVSV